MSSDGTAMPGHGDGTPSLPNLQVVGQYIKDLSFENPGAPAGLTAAAPDRTRRRPAGPARRRRAFRSRAEAARPCQGRRQPLFLLELAYAGLFRLQNIPEDAMQQILLIQAPHMLFPFARRIVADVVRDGGMPPLMIEPIDFVALYQAKMGQARIGTRQPSGTGLSPDSGQFPDRVCRPVPWRRRRHGGAISSAVMRGASGSGRWRARPTSASRRRGHDLHRRQRQAALPAADQFQIDLRRQLGVEQRAMLGARR